MIYVNTAAQLYAPLPNLLLYFTVTLLCGRLLRIQRLPCYEAEAGVDGF